MKVNDFFASTLSAVIGVMLCVAIASAQKAATESRNENSLTPQVTALMIEEFNYPTGQLTLNSPWIANTGTGNFIQVTAGSLTYAAYPSSGIGNKIDIVASTASSEDAYRDFPPQSSGTVYAAFMVRVADTTLLPLNSSTTGEYFAGLIASNSTSNFADRVTIRQGTVANTYQLGFRATGNAGNTQVFSTTDLPVATTALVVISYQIVAGAANDVTNIWINPAIGGSEPAATLSQVSAADSTDIGRFFVRQGSGSGVSTPNASIDGIRVGTSWASVTTPATVPAVSLDFNGDGKTDWSLIRNTGGLKLWYILTNTGGAQIGAQWGVTSDREAPADYDGDSKTDIAVWRAAAPSTFYILQSATNTVKIDNFGLSGDRPTTVRDYDGDGKADVSVYREGATAGAQSYFFYRASSNNPNGNITYIPWGTNGDTETQGDFDGDGKGDFCVRRNIGGAGVFIVSKSTGGIEWINWGLPTDAILPGDYDGDGRSDFGVARVNGDAYNIYILERDGGGTGASPIVFGSSSLNDNAAFGDYDGDGKTDVGVWRPNADPGQNYFYVRLTGTGAVITQEWGQSGDEALGEWNVTGGGK